LQEANSQLNPSTPVNWSSLLGGLAGNMLWAATVLLPVDGEIIAGIKATQFLLFALSTAGIGVSTISSLAPPPPSGVPNADQFDTWFRAYIDKAQGTWVARARTNMGTMRAQNLLSVARLAASPDSLDRINHAVLGKVFGQFVAPEYNVFAPLNTDLIKDTVAVNLLARLALASGPQPGTQDYATNPFTTVLGRITYNYEFSRDDPMQGPSDFSSLYSGVTFWIPPGIDEGQFEQLVKATWGRDGRIDVKDINVPKAVYVYKAGGASEGATGAVLLKPDNSFDSYVGQANEYRYIEPVYGQQYPNTDQWGVNILKAVWPSGQPPEASVAKIKVSNGLGPLTGDG